MIINKVAESGIVTIDPANFLVQESNIELFDLKDFLFMGLILKEKDFRAALKELSWEKYSQQSVAISCTADAIIPAWAYMLVVSYLHPTASEIYQGTTTEAAKYLTLKNISQIIIDEYADKRIVLKGCGDTPIPDYMYAELTKILKPVSKSIMYGEPCSTVPVYKKPAATTE